MQQFLCAHRSYVQYIWKITNSELRIEADYSATALCNTGAYRKVLLQLQETLEILCLPYSYV